MQSTLKIWFRNREFYHQFLEKYNAEQLNLMPEAFNNNLIWNIGHVLVVHQRLHYTLSGLQMDVSEEFFQMFKPGSKPERLISVEEIETLKKMSEKQLTQTPEDIKNGLFQNFQEYTTSTGFHLKTFAEAHEFNNFHEALHLGYMQSIRKFV